MIKCIHTGNILLIGYWDEISRILRSPRALQVVQGKEGAGIAMSPIIGVNDAAGIEVEHFTFSFQPDDGMCAHYVKETTGLTLAKSVPSTIRSN